MRAKRVKGLNSGLNQGEYGGRKMITWKVAANTSSHGSEETANANPVRGGTGSNTKDTGNEEGHVEGKTTTYDIGSDTPDGGADAETDEEGAGGVTDLLGRDVELLGERGERESDALEP
jgi:hypothetical protein